LRQPADSECKKTINDRKDWIPDRACPVPDTGSGMTAVNFYG
jgi:hypothetical protein